MYNIHIYIIIALSTTVLNTQTRHIHDTVPNGLTSQGKRGEVFDLNLGQRNYGFFFFLILQYCISFAKYRNESATGIHVFPILNLPPSSLPIPSLWVVPVHQPQASSIVHRTWTGNSFSYMILYMFHCHSHQEK